jgi:hypothetical protein
VVGLAGSVVVVVVGGVVVGVVVATVVCTKVVGVEDVDVVDDDVGAGFGCVTTVAMTTGLGGFGMRVAEIGPP